MRTVERVCYSSSRTSGETGTSFSCNICETPVHDRVTMPFVAVP
jgi:hypothetical protein